MESQIFKKIITAFCFVLTLFCLEQKLSAATALVTGASRGIGFSLVKQLLEEDIQVIAVVRNKAALTELSQKYPQNLQIIEADLSLAQGISHVANSITNNKIDFLVHNAAVIEPLGVDALLDAPVATLRKLIETNIMAPILLTASLGSKLNEGARILNVSSRAGEKAYQGLGMYCTSKAALDMYTESLQLDHPHGILAAAVHPGEVDTGMQEDLRTHDSKEFPFSDFFKKNQKQGKLLSPDISAEYLKWLLLKTNDDYFVQFKHNIYEPSHHTQWLKGHFPIAY
jgi:benzil reductase ((S)-benzoin forming)